MNLLFYAIFIIIQFTVKWGNNMNENTKMDVLNEQFSIRTLTHEDYQDICEICENIWDGTDYLPDVFHQWVDDNGGFFGIVEKATNKVVGVDKFSVLADGSGWLEGLRVHPAYRGKGLSKALTDHIMAVATRELDAGRVARLAFSTHITSKESIGLMSKRKFTLMQQYALAIRNYKKVEFGPDSVVFSPWTPTYEEVRDSEYLKRRDYILPLAFYFQKFTLPYFNYLKEKGAFIMVNGHKGIQFFKGGESYIIALEETAEAILAFSDWAWKEYKDISKDFPMASVFATDKDLIEALKALGFENWMDWEPDYLYFLYKS